ncbi:DUF3060 family protein [Novosphingobium sp. PhB55]|jgi:hypothetical protein|nr:DUF3060 family protein [Novosphingobium sp. PhB55]
MAMSTSRRFLYSGLALLAGGGLALPASAQASLEGAGQTSTLDCGGGTAEITGSQNRVTVEGACTRLVVEGSGNVVTAALAEKATISVVGTSNRISWRAPGKAAPRVSNTGVGNSVSRAN